MKTDRISNEAFWTATAVVWAIAAVGVWMWTTRYQFTAYLDDEASQVVCWPKGTGLELAQDRPTLLFFMHPRCPCTRASVRELERTLLSAGLPEGKRPKCIIVASLPPTASPEWRDTATIRRASNLPEGEIVWDINGVETKLFGATTSGAVHLFGSDQQLLFAGGVTSSRGHEGDNVGSELLYHLLTEGQFAEDRLARWESTPVFGCRLCVASSASACGEVCQVSRPVVRPDVEGGTL